MNINTSIGLRDRSRITLSNFKGLDTLSATVDVSAIHATDMKNLISRDGVNHKRYGWKTQYRLRDNGEFLKIQGVFDLTLFGERFLIAYAGKRFWLIDLSNYTHRDITNYALTSANVVTSDSASVSPVNRTLLSDAECKCFINGNKAYFIGCGDFLVFSKWENGKFEFRRVVGNEDVYIPTTTENIGSEEYGKNFTRVTAEERNLLSPYTYNLLMGVDELGEGVATYYLDCQNFSNLELFVETSEGTKHLKRESDKKEYEVEEQLKNVEIVVNNTKDYSEEYDVELQYLWLTDKVAIPVNIEDYELMLFEKGALKIKHEIERINKFEYGELEGYNISYNVPEIKAKLVYVNEDAETIVKDLGKAKVSFSVKNVSTERDENSRVFSLQGDLSVEYESIIADLTNYNLIIKQIQNGEYYNIGEFDIKDGDYQGTVYPFEGKLELKSGDYKTLTPNSSNIKAKITREYNPNIIMASTKACEFGAQGGTDRLFVVDNSGNTIRWSKDEDFTYFGEKSWCVCGTSDKSITGMDRLNDSTLLIAKEYSLREPSIFIITGNIVTGETDAGTVDYTALFTPHGYQVGMGAVGEIVNFNGECLMVAKDGLYAVSLGENMTVDSRYVLHRSRQISNKLEKFDLSKAKCVSFNEKFFVYVGGEEQECYVADNKYTASFEGDIQNVVNYEWWRWTNVPVNVWGFVENELWFGTNDGQLCCFTENFYDETLTSFPAGKGLVYYDCEHNDDNCDCGNILGFGFVNDIKFKTGDIFTPTCDFYGGITTDRFECVDGETKFYLPLNDYLDGEKINIDNTAYTITKHDLYFSIPYTTELTELTIYKNYKNKALSVYGAVTTDLFECVGGEMRFYELPFIDGETIYIKNTPYKITKNNSYFSIPYTTSTKEVTIYSSIITDYVVLRDCAGSFPKWSAVISNGGLNPSINNFSATLSHKEPVVSKWVSGAMDLGTRAYSKSLTYLVLTGEKDLANRLKYGLKTRFTHRDYELLRANNDLDFTELDLQTVSMDSDFASSYTKKLNIRNVNFIMFYFLSDTANDIALNSVQIEFKLHKRNIGVK